MELTRERAQLGATSDRLALVLAASPVVLCSRRLDAPDRPLTWVSDNLARLLGYEVAAALAPDWWRAHLDPQDLAEIEAWLNKHRKVPGALLQRLGGDWGNPEITGLRNALLEQISQFDYARALDTLTLLREKSPS